MGRYLADAAVGRRHDKFYEFTEDLRYVAPGRNTLWGERYGAEAPAK